MNVEHERDHSAGLGVTLHCLRSGALPWLPFDPGVEIRREALACPFFSCFNRAYMEAAHTTDLAQPIRGRGLISTGLSAAFSLAVRLVTYATRKDTVKGLRTVTKYEVTDHRALLNWIAKNDRDAITDFINDWARKEHKARANADGLRVWTEKEAF